MNYEQAAYALSDRILALIPKHPEILEMRDPWLLFDVEGFECDDLDPSFAQASVALAYAIHKYEEQNP